MKERRSAAARSRLVQTRPPRLRLKEWRQASGLSQDDLARRCGISRATIGFIENDSRRAVLPTTVERLAQALALEPADLFRLPDERGKV